MKLSAQEVKLFYELMRALQFFVNQKLKVLPSITTLEEYSACSVDEKLKVRDALYKNKQLIDLFVKENPEKFSPDKLMIVAEWRNYVKGDFYIERFLKKHGIFVSQGKQVYGVSGLQEGLDEMILAERLPLLVHTVLLPFSGKIIYDGLFKVYNSLHFGGGIRRDIKESYMTAKQNNRIIESLESHPLSKPPKVQALKDWEPEINELCEKAKRLKAGPNYPFTYGAAFGLVKAGLEFAQVVVSPSKDLDAMYKSLRKVQRELKKAYTIILREEE